MIPFLRRLSAGLAFRRSVIALGGGACAALCAVILAHAARPQLNAPTVVADNRPTIIDGPPKNGEAAPPPPALKPHRRSAAPFTDDDSYEDVFDAAPFRAGPPQAGPDSMQPPQEAAQMQASRTQPASSNPCARFSGPADQMVCAYPRLNAADVALQRLYGMALYQTENPEALREEQRRWRAVRDQVAAEDGPQALAELYAERIQELNGPYY